MFLLLDVLIKKLLYWGAKCVVNLSRERGINQINQTSNHKSNISIILQLIGFLVAPWRVYEVGQRSSLTSRLKCICPPRTYDCCNKQCSQRRNVTRIIIALSRCHLRSIRLYPCTGSCVMCLSHGWGSQAGFAVARPSKMSIERLRRIPIGIPGSGVISGVGSRQSPLTEIGIWAFA